MKPITDLYFNANVITVNEKACYATAFTVEKGCFREVGEQERLIRDYGANACLHDLQGKTVVPGLNDGHAHPVGACLTEVDAELPVLHDVKSLLDWIRSEAGKTKKGEWIVHPNCYPYRLAELRFPTLEELNLAAPDHPVFLSGYYSGVTNTCGIKLSKLESAVSQSGLGRDLRTGALNGRLGKEAFSLLSFLSGRKLTRTERKNQLRKMLSAYNAVGITSTNETLWSNEHWVILNELAEEDGLTARVSLNFMPGLLKERSEVDMVLKEVRFRTGSGDDFLRVGPYKTIIDGGILTGTAYMRQSWGKRTKELLGQTDKDYHGVCNYSLEELTGLVVAAAENGFSFTAHVTGDAGLDLLVCAYEAADKQVGIRDKRFQILHGNFIDQDILSRCADLGLLLDIQPVWFYKDYNVLRTLLGPERLNSFHPWQAMLKKGLTICSGSDHMAKFNPNESINPFNPFIGLYTLVSRGTEQGNIEGAEQAISPYEALKTYTYNNAVKSSEEKIKGSIEPGKLADFVVLDRNPLACGAEALLRTSVLATYLGGVCVFSNAS